MKKNIKKLTKLRMQNLKCHERNEVNAKVTFFLDFKVVKLQKKKVYKQSFQKLYCQTHGYCMKWDQYWKSFTPFIPRARALVWRGVQGLKPVVNLQ